MVSSYEPILSEGLALHCQGWVLGMSDRRSPVFDEYDCALVSILLYDDWSSYYE